MKEPHGCTFMYAVRVTREAEQWQMCVQKRRTVWSSHELGGALPTSGHSGLLDRHTNLRYSSRDTWRFPRHMYHPREGWPPMPFPSLSFVRSPLACMIGMGFGNILVLYPTAALSRSGGVSVTHRHCCFRLIRLAAPVSMGATGSIAGSLAWFTTFTALLATVFWTHTSWYFLHKASLCDHGYILLCTGSHRRGSEYIDPLLVGECNHSLRPDE